MRGPCLPSTALLSSALLLSTASASDDAFGDRARELVADYGVSGSYYVASPGSGTAATEWKKGVFAASLAAFAEGDVSEGRARADAGLNYRLNSDMFYLYGLIELWQRMPGEFADPADGPLDGRLDLSKVKEALWSHCWAQNPGSTDNHRMMYYTAALFGATHDATSSRGTQTAGSSCTDYDADLSEVGASDWLENFIDQTVLNGFPESDSATYVAAYLAPLRLIADRYTSVDTSTDAAALANKAAKAFDWMVANMATEWTNGSFTATTGREYFPADGSVYRPAELGNYLRVLFGGRVRSGERTWEDSGGGIRKPLAAMSIPLALTSYRPSAELLVAATDRSVPFEHRESARMSTLPNPSRSLRTRYVEPGLFELASASDGPGGYGSLQAQNFTFHADSPGFENRTLTIANPQNSSVWTSNLTAGFKPLGGRPELQWLQDGRTAVGVLDTTTGPTMIRGALGDDMLQASWGAGSYSGNAWHVYGVDNKLWVGVRTVVAATDEGNGDPFDTLDDSWFFSAKNPGNTRGGFVIVETMPQSQMTRGAFAAELNRSTPSPRVVCSGIAGGGCSMPTPSSRATVSFTNLAGRTLTIGFPDGSGPAQRTIDGVPQDESSWPVLQTPWTQQDAGSNVLRVSAVTGTASTTKVTEYGSYTTVSATQSFVGASGKLEAWGGTAPNQQPTGWVIATWLGSASYLRSSSAHTGAYGGQVTLAAPGNGGFALNAAYRPAASQSRATVTAWIKPSGVSTAAGDGAYVWAQYARSDGTLVCTPVLSQPVSGTAHGWLSRSVTLPAKSCDASATKVAISVRLRGTGSVLIDDVDFAAHP